MYIDTCININKCMYVCAEIDRERSWTCIRRLEGAGQIPGVADSDAKLARRTAASSKTAESVAGVCPPVIVGRYRYWTSRTYWHGLSLALLV